jgi:methyl-accepting chemotaxis protein
VGRGFAVVAQEVKSFSQQAASTTRDIAERIHDISQATNSAVGVSTMLGSALVSVSSSAMQTIEMTERQHSTNTELQQMIITIETATGAAREALDSLNGMFGQTATVAHQTRLISTDMRTRTEKLQHECERIVAMLRNSDRVVEPA